MLIRKLIKIADLACPFDESLEEMVQKMFLHKFGKKINLYEFVRILGEHNRGNLIYIYQIKKIPNSTENRKIYIPPYTLR